MAGYMATSQKKTLFVGVMVYRHKTSDTCISNIDNTRHEEETSNNRRKTKSLHCPLLDHHDADGLAGEKTWRTTQTTMRRYKYAIQKSVNST
jgi:hypothetical protein